MLDYVLRKQFFLIFMAAGLSIIGTSYGLFHDTFIIGLYQIDSETANSPHIFKAVMGLYWGTSIFWLASALKKEWQTPAVASTILAMLGLAFGRIASMLFDGAPHWLLIIYTVIELFCAAYGAIVFFRTEETETSRVN